LHIIAILWFSWGNSALKKIANGTDGAVLGGTAGVIRGGGETLLGYGIGYLAGYTIK